MSLTNNKKDVLDTIGAYTSLRNQRDLPEGNLKFSSLNENRNPLDFLMDVLNVIIGSEAIKILIGELLSNIVDEIEPKLKDSLKMNHMDYNSSNILPDYFFNEGVEIPIEDIDFFDTLKTDPNSDVGSLIYGKNVSDDNFDKSAYDAIISNESTYNNIRITYNEINDSFIFRANATSTSTTIGQWKDSFIDQTTILEKDVFVANVMNNIFGTMSSAQGKSLEKIVDELKTKKILDKIIDKSLDKDIDTDDLTIDDNELNEIFDDAKNIKDGVLKYNICCEEVLKQIDVDDLKSIVSNISESTNPAEIANIVEDAIINNTNFDDDSLDDETLKNNKETVIDGFFNRLVHSIKFEITKMLVLSPQTVTLNLLLEVFKNNGEYESKTQSEFMSENQTLCGCIIKDVMKEINGFIFNLAVTALMDLLKPIIKKIIKEKIMQYVSILKSLIGR